jgi:Ribbon-helix-helix protein, copG family
MYAPVMKRLQIMIDEDLDDALGRLAGEQGVSKAALIRRFVRERLSPLPPLSADPLSRFSGSARFEPAAVDDVVYR